MLFDVEADEGSKIIVYVIPDTGGTTPSVRVRAAGADLLTLEANDRRDYLIESGRHSTGLCGFVIDDSLIPNLADYGDLEIFELSNNILIYKRRPPKAVDANVFRLETHLLPLWRLDESLKHRFQSFYYGVDRFGRETSTQVFCLETPSRYISGRLLYKNFEFYLSKGVKCVAILRDPFDELAERLVLLKNIGTRAEEILGARDAMTFAPAIAALQDCDLTDEAACKRFFRKVPFEVTAALSNPLVRQLTTATPDEMPGNASIASSLDALASFEVLGLRSDGEGFSKALADLIGVEPGEMPQIGEYPRIAELGGRLRGIHDIEEFLEKDLEIFHLITHAFKSAEAHG